MLVQLNDELLEDIADSLREVTESETTYLASEMPHAVRNLYTVMTQAEYDALESYVTDMIYLIKKEA